MANQSLEMIKNSFQSRYLLLSAPLFQNSESSKESSDDYNKYGGLFIEDKWERVRLIFQKDNMGNNHPDLDHIIEVAYIGFIGGTVVGGLVESYRHVEKYFDKNDATLFFSKIQAHRELGRQAIIGFGKGVWRTGPLFGVFLGGYMLFSTCMQAYRNKKGIIEYSFGGFSIGALLRFNYGWRGMLSGGIVGGTLGTFYGIYNIAKLKMLNMTESEFRHGQMSLSAYRKKWKEKQLAETEEKKK